MSISARVRPAFRVNADGGIVWSWHSTLVSSFAVIICEPTVANKPGTPAIRRADVRARDHEAPGCRQALHDCLSQGAALLQRRAGRQGFARRTGLDPYQKHLR